MTTHFTPAPWGIARPHGDVVYVQFKDPKSPYALHIATVSNEANAALIATAPELYAIVEGELQNLEFNSLGKGARAIEMRKVLAKARGE